MRGSSGFVGALVAAGLGGRGNRTRDLLQWPLLVVSGMGVDGGGIEAVRELSGGGGCVCEKG